MTPDIPSTAARSPQDTTPLSLEQQRLWILSQTPAARACQRQVAFRLCGELDEAALRRALDALAARHPILRTVYTADDAMSLRAVVCAEESFALRRTEGSISGPVASQLEAALVEERVVPMDPECGPLARALLVRISEREHLLVITLHELICDRASAVLLCSELGDEYSAIVRGTATLHASSTLQYAQFAAQQRSALNRGELSAQRDYWRSALADVPSVLDLPTDRPRPREQSYTSQSIQLELDATLCDGLEDVTQRYHTTVQALVISAWAIVLGRLSGQHTVAIGVRTTNRRRREFQSLIGPVSNAVPVIITIEPQLPTREFLRKADATLRGALDNQDLPFEQIAKLAPTRPSLSHSPVFQVLFEYIDYPSEQLALYGLEVAKFEIQASHSLYDLTLTLRQESGRMSVMLTYSTALYDTQRMQSHAHYLRRVLTQIAADEQIEASRIDLLSPVERNELLYQLSGAAFAVPSQQCIQQLFEAQVLRTPTSIALVHGTQSWTYDRLNRLSNQLARHLRGLGVRSDELVGLFVERGPMMLVSMLAVLKSGGAYVPLDPAYPQERLSYMLEKARPRALLTEEQVCEMLPPWRGDIVNLDRDLQLIGSQPDENLTGDWVGWEPHHLAYVIFTSGSTGEPKGVMVEHAAVVNFLTAMQRQPGVTEADTVLAITTISFDIAVLELFLPLVAGAKVVIADRTDAVDPRALIDLMEHQDVTILQATPATWQLLLSAGWAGRDRLKALCGGEALTSAMSSQLRPKVGSLWNLYGPTETTVWSCAREVRSIALNGPAVEPIGRPIANTYVYVLDGDRNPVPKGVIGELYIGGVGVARGYLNRPDLTQERFFPNPFSAARMYRTGDLVRWRPDGILEYLGRNDQQVKIRGFRVELGDVEAALARLESIKQCAVIGNSQGSGDLHLVAYVVARPGCDLSSASLRRSLSKALPGYMVPSVFVSVAALPRLPNGKIDRAALPTTRPHTISSRTYEAPVGFIEQTLAAIWEEALQVDLVGRHDNFFELGGHSILMVQLAERLRRQSLVVQPRTIHANPTVCTLSRALAGESAQAYSVPPNLIPADCARITPAMLPLAELTQEQISIIEQAVPGGAENIQDIYPLAPLQEGILFHYLMNEGSSDAYILPTLLLVPNKDVLAQLRNAIEKAVERHDVLRTAVVWEHLPKPVQVVHRRASLLVEDLPLSPQTDALEQMQGLLRGNRQKMDLRKAPLVRLLVARDPKSSNCYALFELHHIAGDYVAQQALLSEIDAHLQHKGTSLPPSIPYRNHVARSNASEQSRNAEAFFRAKLADIEETTAPYGVLQVHGDGSQTQDGYLTLAESLSTRIRQSARTCAASPATLFHAAWALVVGACGAKDDVVFGAVLLGRLHASESAAGALGMFINTLPIRLRLTDKTARALVEHTQRELTELMGFEQASLAVAQQCSGVSGSIPLFTSLLNYRYAAQSAPDRPVVSAGIQVLAGQERTNYPLTVSVDDFGKGFALTAHAIAPINASRILAYLGTALEGLARAIESNSAAAAVCISVLPEDERHRLLNTFNATSADYGSPCRIHDLFVAQAHRTPNATAAICGHERLTYDQLNGLTDRLAAVLRTRGVTAEQVVGLCVERGIQMIVGLLGILKAGGAYVPLDPSYPRGRLQQLIEDAAPRLVLTLDRLEHLIPAAEGIELLCLDGPWEGTESQDIVDGLSVSRPEHLAYLIYTSGSTGRPKGVAIEHRNAVNLIRWAQSTLSESQRACMLFSTSLNFDLSVYECFVPLSCGGCIEIVDNALHLDPSKPVTLVNTVPSAMNALIEGAQLPGTLLRVNLAGEVLHRDVVEGVFSCANVEEICNLYGPSETTTYSSWVSMDRRSGFVGTIGRPIANTQFYILNSRGDLAPHGAVGEIYIGGAGVARGYWRRPELTAERFLSDPFSTDQQARMYRTGDLGRWTLDGEIEYLGRTDHQVKVRGFRIELGEIETQLVQHPQVARAVVVSREDPPGHKQVVAYVTPHNAADVSVDELRSYLQAILPEYMVPAAIVRLDSIPLTKNGKLDRTALPAPQLSTLGSQGFQPPQGHLEEVLAGIWQALLRAPRVGRDDNFFDLGGNSLLIVQVMERLRRVGLKTTVRQLFQCSTLKDLASVLTPGRGEEAIAPANAIPPQCTLITPEMLPLVQLDPGHIRTITEAVKGGAANVQDIYPLTPLQQGILFHHRLLEGAGDTYVMPLMLCFRSRAVLDRFVSALNTVIARHDALRTAIHWDQLPAPVQVVLRHAPLTVTDISSQTGNAEVMEQMIERMTLDAQHLNLAEAPLIGLDFAVDADTQRCYGILKIHHIVCDNASLSTVLSEVNTLLAIPDVVLATPIPYRDHVAHVLAASNLESAEEFFCSRLGDITETTAPFDVRSVHGSGADVRQEAGRVPLDVARLTRQIARRLGVSLATLFHAAWALVVGDTTGRSEVVFGSVLLGRLQSGAAAQTAVGMFINTLPLRVSLKGQTVKSLVEQCQLSLIELLGHEQSSLTLAQRCSGVGGSEPLFTSILNFRHSQPDLSGNAVGPTGVEVLNLRAWTNYPLMLSVDEFDDTFRLAVDADPNIDAGRVLGYIQTVLANLVGALDGAPESSALTLSSLPDLERELLFRAFNDTTVSEYVDGTRVHELFEQQVERAPEAVALVHRDESLSYGELNHRANQLARYMREQGAGAGAIVGLCLERDLDMVVAVVAALKAGCAYLPLDPTYPEVRLRYMVEDAKPAVVVTHSTHQALAPGLGAKRIDLDKSLADIARQSTENLHLPRTNGQHVYLIYTSGSTGRPKGVLMPHRSVVNLLLWHKETFGTERRRVLQFAALSFDVAFQEIFSTLCLGSTLVLPDEWIRRDARELLAFIARQAINRLFVPPLMLRALAEQFILDSVVPHRLQDVISAGEQLRITPAMKTFFKALGNCRLHNHYGPTETHVVTTHTLPAEDTDSWPTRVPIGRPISNARVFICDDSGRPCPLGVTGEICIAGIGLADGYLGLPEQTNARFIPAPFLEEASGRVYRTGDKGKWRADGCLEYLGRNDEQVKIRGYRIELGEIECELARHPAVHAVAAVVREDVMGERRLAAYVVPKVGFTPTAGELRRHLTSVLPEHMVPTHVVLLTALPISPNGKLDRLALPKPELATDPRTQDCGLQGDVEIRLGSLWKDVLHADEVGRRENFFDVGGHSILATVLLGNVEREFGTRMSLRDFFTHPTIAGLARLLSDAAHGPRLAMAPIPRNGGLPVSYAQERMWILARFEDGAATYHVPLILRLRGSLDVPSLTRAIESVVDRHEILRSRIIHNGLELQQLADPPGGFTVRHEALSSDEDLLDACQTELRLPFDLAAGGLFRARIVRLAANDHVIQFTFHHMVTDGWSSSIFLRELSDLYGAFCRGQPSPLPELRIQYADFVHWQNSLLTAQTLAPSLDYWRARLAGLEALMGLPTDRPRPAIKTYRGGQRYFTLSSEVTRALADLSKQGNATLFMTTLAAFLVLLHRYSGSDDVAVGTPVANRDRPESQPLIGLFINTLVLRCAITDKQSFAETLALVRDAALGAYAHQEVPFEYLVNQLRPTRSLSHGPFFEVMFVFQNQPGSGVIFEGLDASAPNPTTGTAKFDLNLSLYGDADGMAGIFEFNTDLYDGETIERLIGHYTHILTAVASTPGQLIGDIPLLGKAEEDQVILHWNATAADYERNTCIHQLFERRVLTQPQATALRDGRATITYDELNRAANRLAWQLIDKGAKPGTTVAICIDRNFNLIVAVLAVLKSGAAYVPIDPAYPKGRVDWIITDSKAQIAIAQPQHAGLVSSVPQKIVADGTWLSTTKHRKEGPVEGMLEELLEDNPDRSGLESTHIAYIIYTSGSTGRPKGVVVQHRPVINVIEWMNRTWEVGSNDVLLFVSSISFDLSVYDIFGSLAAGASIRIADDTLLREPAQVANVLATEHITIWDSAPARLQQIVPFLSAQHAQSPGNTLRLVFLSGDWIPVSLPDAVRGTFSRAAVISLGGATEAAIWSNYYPVGVVGHDWVSIPYGKPIQNAQYYVLDKNRRPCPIGIPGDLYISGECLAMGYNNDSELTCRKFVPNPFHPGQLMYATGDLSRWMSDGNLQFLGRSDSQVKVRGFRVELGEIERCLLLHEDVSEAVVIARSDQDKQKFLCAYFVSSRDMEGAEIREHLSQLLPDYMIPLFTVRLDRMPVSANGKLDRSALPEPERRRQGVNGTTTLRLSELETQVVKLVAETLGLPAVALSDNFFDLGGTSLSLARLNRIVNATFGKSMTMVELFQSPTAASICSYIQGEVKPEASWPAGSDSDLLTAIQILGGDDSHVPASLH